MVRELDIKDKKILYELTLNARQPLSNIAKIVGLSVQAIKYRLDRLEKIGFVSQYFASIDCSKIGYSFYKVYVKLHGLNEKEERKMVEDLVNNGYVAGVCSCDGNWDMLIYIMAHDIFEFSHNYREALEKYTRYFSRKSVITVTEAVQYTRKYLCWREKDFSAITWAKGMGKETIDKLDLDVLITLSQNARMSIVELSKKVNSEPRTVLYRIEKLKKRGILFSYQPFLNNEKLGILRYKLLLTLQNLTPEVEKKIMAYANTHAHVFEFTNNFGAWEMEFDVEVPDMTALHSLIRELKDKFTHIIRECEPLHMYKFHKYNYLPSYGLHKT